ncbi:hypothetical protein Acsp02_19110 [Actinoplanes sp. NBRC 103695]|nr:hypothetical protein Acsp02_19110 [Actinoplanes sp. NBRC 103695]
MPRWRSLTTHPENGRPPNPVHIPTSPDHSDPRPRPRPRLRLRLRTTGPPGSRQTPATVRPGFARNHHPVNPLPARAIAPPATVDQGRETHAPTRTGIEQAVPAT